MILNKEKILEQARLFTDEGKYDRAIREYEKIIQADPADMRVKLKIAELYTKRKMITEAIRIYREVADAYAAESFYLKAVTVYKNILRLNPALFETNEQLALLYEKMGLISDAIRQYDILASAVEQRGKTDHAVEIRAKIVKLDPNDISGRIRLAELYQREGEIDKAIEHYEAYAGLLEKDGTQKRKIADIFEKIVTHKPDDTEVFHKLIYILKELGDNKKILGWLDEREIITENDPSLLRLAADILAVENQNDSARSKYILMAEIYRERGDIDSALDAFAEVLALFPDEEDKVQYHAETLKSGSMPEVILMANQKREAREQKELERQKEETAAAAPAKPEPAPEKSKTAFKPSVVETKPLPDLKDADSAFDLGFAYSKMGLAEEAAIEFKKAHDIYSAHLAAGGGHEDLKEKIAQIEKFGEQK